MNVNSSNSDDLINTFVTMSINGGCGFYVYSTFIFLAGHVFPLTLCVGCLSIFVEAIFTTCKCANIATKLIMFGRSYAKLA